jgi:DtxR family manganese transport transcriptional regulator
MVMEDYLRAILELEDSEGQCRVSEIADHFGVTHVTVIRTVQRLEKLDLLETEPYRPLRLSSKGRQRAQACRTRFELAVSFLEAIGVPRSEARLDADGIEHFLGTATTRQMRSALEQAGDRLESPRRTPA